VGYTWSLSTASSFLLVKYWWSENLWVSKYLCNCKVRWKHFASNIVVVHVDGVRLCPWTVEWRAMVEWYWQGKPKNLEKNLSQCHCVYHKSHIDWLACEPWPPRWEAGNYLSEPWHGLPSYVTGYCYGMVLYKASHALQPFSDVLYIPIWVLVTPHSSTSALIPAETSSSEAGSWQDVSLNLADVSLSYYARFFNMPYKLTTWDQWLSPPKEGVLHGFLLTFKIHCLGQVWTCDPWIQWQAR
jgi:hypothetical protein